MPNMLKKKIEKKGGSQEQIILLGCQHQSMLWILTEPGEKQEGSVSNSEHSFLLESYFKKIKGHSIVLRKKFLVACALFLFHEPLGMRFLWWLRLCSVQLQTF